MKSTRSVLVVTTRYYKYEWNNCFWFSGGSDGATHYFVGISIPLKEHQDGPATGLVHLGSGSSAQRRGFVFGIRVFSLSKSHGLSSVFPLSDKRIWADLPPSAASFWLICLGQSWDLLWPVIFRVYRVYWWLYHVVSVSCCISIMLYPHLWGKKYMFNRLDHIAYTIFV